MGLSQSKCIKCEVPLSYYAGHVDKKGGLTCSQHHVTAGSNICRDCNQNVHTSFNCYHRFT